MGLQKSNDPVLQNILAQLKSLNEKVDLLTKDKKEKEIKETYNFSQAEQHVKELIEKARQEARDFVYSLDGWSLSEKEMLLRIVEGD
ncbi:hypothetical protein ABES80_00965 [Bacillus gobiensis]|uniref:hypothetical protein n=1 Tax=Bacillus gobiensis TaxID=1441095 RepID=UPI003D22753B